MNDTHFPVLYVQSNLLLEIYVYSILEQIYT